MLTTKTLFFRHLRIFVILFYREQYDSVNSSPQLYQTLMFTTEEDWLWKKLLHSASQEISQTWSLLMKIVKYQVSFSKEVILDHLHPLLNYIKKDKEVFPITLRTKFSKPENHESLSKILWTIFFLSKRCRNKQDSFREFIM